MKLAKSEGIVAKKMRIEKSPNCIPADTVQMVEEFFLLDSISRQAPGKRDFVTVRKDGGKEQVQKRHLLWSLQETYALFKKEHSSVKIGFSKFCSLRPQNVLLLGQYPHQACLCVYHENIRLLCDCLSKSIPDFSNYSGGFVDCFVCSPESESCMFGQCDECPSPVWIESISKEDLSLMVTWYQWQRVVQKMKGKESNSTVKKMEKICKEGTLEDALCMLKEQLPFFLKHVYIKREQAKYFESKIENLQEDEAVVQVDFSENYTCKHQDEIQTAHWSQEQVTIFPVAIWTISDEQNQKTCSSHVFVTDDRSHDKKAVAVFMDRVFRSLVSDKSSKVKRVHVFSDGPSSQFKNKYMVNFYHQLRKNVKFTWNFFATSHGKGVVDGIGGTVKRVVWRAVSSRRVPVVADAQSFAQVASKLCKAVKVSFISSEELNRSADLLDLSTCFNEAAAIPGISKYHCIEPLENGLVCFRIHSSQAEYVELGDSHSDDDYTTSSEFESADDDESCHSDVDDDDDDRDDNRKQQAATGLSEHDDSDDDDSDEVNNNNARSDQDINASSAAVTIEHGLPKDCQLLFDVSKPFQLPFHLQYKADAIANGILPFDGPSIISGSDIEALLGGSSVERENWLSNFVIDQYLDLLKTEHSENNFRIKTIWWERFERAVGILPAKEIWKEEDPLCSFDLVFVPCNTLQTEHWFSLVVMPKQNQVLALDSMAGDFLKPTVNHALCKMAFFLTDLESIDLSEWRFFSNRKEDLPQQPNLSDCGVYACQFAKCLFSRDRCMVSEDHGSILQFRKCMILELHQKEIFTMPLEDIECENYYAVEYETKFYIGRTTRVIEDKVEFKFLHQVVKTFKWPLRDDNDIVYKRRVFFGPTVLAGTGPFEIPSLGDIDKLFKYLRKQNVFK